MKALWGILCQSSSIDRDTNALSLFNIIEGAAIVSPEPPQPSSEGQLPQTLGQFQFVVSWARSNPEVAERGRGRVRVSLPSDNEFGPPREFEVDLTAHLHLRMRIQFPGLPLGGEGDYRFVVEKQTPEGNWLEESSAILRVVYQTPDSS